MRQTFNRQTPDPQTRSNLGFLEILGLGGVWLLISLLIIWQYMGQFFDYLYYICQSSWESLTQHLPSGLHLIILIIPILMIMTLGRGVFLFIVRLQATRRFRQVLTLCQIQAAPRLVNLAWQVGLRAEDLACFEASTIQAFSLGAWRPKVWLSTGLLTLLDDAELTAVLQHEAHHCQKRDPLRLLVSRLVSDSFFFVPLLCNLAEHNHLAQEMAADATAIQKMGDSTPLASALHKLLTAPGVALAVSDIAVSQLNVTERRILALVSPQQQPQWQGPLSRWLVSLLMAFLLLGAIAFIKPAELARAAVYQPLHTCTSTATPILQLTLSEHPSILVQ